MPDSVAIMSSAGLRSLVATAMLASQPDTPKITLIHLRTSRPTRHNQSRFLKQQAEHYNITDIIEIPAPHLHTHPIENLNELPPHHPLERAQLLLTAYTHATSVRAEKLIWPIQANDDLTTITHATELSILVKQTARIEPAFAANSPNSPITPGQLPTIETPLLDLNDQQLIELGNQLDCPWHLAWSCLIDHDHPCRACAACRRRHAAFNATSIADTAFKQVTQA